MYITIALLLVFIVLASTNVYKSGRVAKNPTLDSYVKKSSQCSDDFRVRVSTYD